MIEPTSSPRPKGKAPFTVRYEQTTALHTSQFVLNAGPEEVMIDCSSGLIREGQGDEGVLPIHTRLALPWSTARQLADLMLQVIMQQEMGSERGGPRTAQLPRMESSRG